VAFNVARREVYGVTNSRAWRNTLIILAATTALRLIIGAIVPLFPDETYYWDWSRTLRPGYFDHPPMIAVLVRAGTTLFGATPIGVRFFPILAGTGAALAVSLTARALMDDVAAFTAALIFACVPLAAAGFVLATPDAPMLCAVSWTMYATIRALQTAAADDTRDSRIWWAIAGLAIGCAMASKYTSVLIPAAIALGCLLHPRLQNRFADLGPYLAVIIASAILAPVLLWNYQHDWISFKFQLGHGLGEPKGGILGALNREVQLVGGQIGLVSPILFFFVARAIKRSFDSTPDGLRLVLGTMAVLPLCFFLYSATRRNVEANWPAVALIPGIVLLAVEPPYSWRAKRWFNGGLIFGGILCAIIYTHVVVPILPLRADRDQVAKAFGWNTLGAAIDRRRDFYSSRSSFGRGDLFIAAERYQDASEIAFHTNGHPRVFSLNLLGRPNQYDMWGTFPERAAPGASLLLVVDDEISEPKLIRKLACCFTRIDQGEKVAMLRGNDPVAKKRLWFLMGWTGEWPLRAQPFPWVD
jgi:4-amino-4-deoxy-L-arabinose transferase-like glycosyltransferase